VSPSTSVASWYTDLVNLSNDMTIDRVVQARDGLSEKTYVRLLDRLLEPHPPEAWRATLRHWFLVGGLLLLVSGIIFFGAYNWEQLARLEKLGLLQAVLVAFFSGIFLRGVESVEGQVLLVASCGVVGGLLAVMGQVYQTGADSYLLFLGWALLILPWCLCGRMNVLWISQMTLLDVTFTLWWYQTVNDDFPTYAPAFLVFNLALVGVWEWLRPRTKWMTTVPSDLLLLAGLTPVTLAGCVFIIDNGHGAINFLCLALVLGALVFFRGNRLISMATVSASLLCLGTTLIGRIFLEGGEEFGILMIGVGIMFQIALIVKWLTHLHQNAEKQIPTDPVPDSSEESTSEEFPLSDQEYEALINADSSLPWYVQTLVGGGAWFASLFVLIFFLLICYSADGGLLVPGGLLYGGSLLLRHRKTPALFFRHALLSVHITGAMVIIAGVAEMGSGEQILSGLTGAILMALSARYYDDALGVFLFCFGFVVCGAVSAEGAFADAGSIVWLLAVMVLLTFLSTLFKRLLQSELKLKVLPALRGLTAGLLCTTLVLNFDFLDFSIMPVFALGALAITIWQSRQLKHPSLAQTGIVALGILTYTVPALIISVYVYLLGFRTQQRLIRGLGILAVGASGCFFYYSLDLTLMAKSLALVASGGFLLLIRVLLGVAHPETEVSEDTYAL
jgi:uncharacterized membrane protein